MARYFYACAVCNNEYSYIPQTTNDDGSMPYIPYTDSANYAQAKSIKCCWPSATCTECGYVHKSSELTTAETLADDCCNCEWCGKGYSNCFCTGCEYCGDKAVTDRGTCSSCGHKDFKQLARSHGLDPTIDFAQVAADYYLLMNLEQVEFSQVAKEKLQTMANKYVPQLETYLDMALGGELRYCYSSLDTDVDGLDVFKEAMGTDFLDFPSPPPVHHHGSRSAAWEEWITWETPKVRAAYAHTHFNSSYLWGSGGGYGGRAWGDIANVLLLRVRDNINPVMWMDRVFNVQHNGGCCLNKLWNVNKMTVYVLPAHGNDDYSTLLAHASPEVRQLWSAEKASSSPADYYRRALGRVAKAREMEVKGKSMAQHAYLAGTFAGSPTDSVESYFSPSRKRRGQMVWQSHFSSE